MRIISNEWKVWRELFSSNTKNLYAWKVKAAVLRSYESLCIFPYSNVIIENFNVCIFIQVAEKAQ